MKSDVQIAREAVGRPIGEIAGAMGLSDSEIHPYGHDKAKVDLSVLSGPRRREGEGKLVLVTAITPTKAGEGKTTTSIGLAQGLAQLGESACLALREPSLGPCMGVKGGATGGGYSQVIPSDQINLHFTGDFHAITSAHNLLATVIDNHLHHGNALGINPLRVLWPRVIDMNDRSLRSIVIGMGGVGQGIPRETGFDITAASEVMAMLCLATDAEDLRARIDRTIVAFTRDRRPVRAEELGVTGAMVALLKDALMPNLVQTLEGVPAFVHGGPFANIAHGCNSVIATRMSMHLADWTITEAGFGCDLGAEKFFDIKCQSAGLDVVAVVLVATIRALKMHGGVGYPELQEPDPAAVERGLPNLEAHLDSVRAFGKEPVIALNRFHSDSLEELEVVQRFAQARGIRCALAEHFAHGGPGAESLARAVMEAAESGSEPLQPMYDWSESVEDKIRAVATKIYGADGIEIEAQARRDLRQIKGLGFTGLPICIAKTQNSISDNPKLLGRPESFQLTVRRVLINAGAGFLVVLTGNIMRMPGLPRRPQAEAIDVVDGEIEGIA